MFSTRSSQKVLIILVLNILQVFCLPQLQEPQTNALAGENFVCPEDFGDFEDPIQCDKYWRCDQGVATSNLCDDGLVFDKFKADGREDPCDSPYVVDCAKRVKLQEPTFPSEICPRRHGFFADPDPTICDIFYTCKNGRHTKTPCSPGLHFDEKTGTCAWPNIANRTGCGKKKQASVNGFFCPVEEVLNDQGMTIPHPSYPNEVDCQKFYVCLNGQTPQEAACNLGQVFNERTMLCDYPENVAECKGWYQNDPRFADYYYDSADGKRTDPGVQDTVG
ncbi:hypothetical protein Avbf_11173 [Armadillidium vulgare]|nr:hypothetical protein Avbf_11173 [Armadillidium vulgare]